MIWGMLLQYRNKIEFERTYVTPSSLNRSQKKKKEFDSICQN